MSRPIIKTISPSDPRARLLAALAETSDDTAAKYLNGDEVRPNLERKLDGALPDALHIRPTHAWKEARRIPRAGTVA